MPDENGLNKDRRHGIGKPRKPYVRHEWHLTNRADYRYKGQATRMAQKLFGSKGRMETPEQREQTALVFRQSDDPRFRLLAARALDPDYKDRPFTYLAEKLGLSLHAMQREYSALMKSEGFIRAAQHLPEIMEQVAVDAKSRDERCQKCEGTGRITKGKGEDVEEITCPACDGNGTQYVLGDTDRLKLLFETFQLTGKAGGVNVNLDMRKFDQPEGLADLASSLDGILEGEVVEPKEEDASEPV